MSSSEDSFVQISNKAVQIIWQKKYANIEKFKNSHLGTNTARQGP